MNGKQLSLTELPEEVAQYVTIIRFWQVIMIYRRLHLNLRLNGIQIKMETSVPVWSWRIITAESGGYVKKDTNGRLLLTTEWLDVDVHSAISTDLFQRKRAWRQCDLTLQRSGTMKKTLLIPPMM